MIVTGLLQRCIQYVNVMRSLSCQIDNAIGFRDPVIPLIKADDLLLCFCFACSINRMSKHLFAIVQDFENVVFFVHLVFPSGGYTAAAGIVYMAVNRVNL